MVFCFHIHKSVILQPPISEIHFCVKGFFSILLVDMIHLVGMEKEIVLFVTHKLL